MCRIEILLIMIYYTSSICFAQPDQDFSMRNVEILMHGVEKPTDAMLKDHYTKLIDQGGLKPVEEFFALSELARIAMNEKNYDAVISNASHAIRIAEKYEDKMTGSLCALYLQDLRNIYEAEEWRAMSGEDEANPREAYLNMLNVFENHEDWKDKHAAEYLSVLVAAVGASESIEEKQKWMDRIIADVPSAQTIPFWIMKRYERDIYKDWENTSERIRTLMDQYDEYPYKIFLYDLLASGYKRQGKLDEALKLYEEGLQHIQKPFKHLSDSDREHFVNGKMTRDTVRSMELTCANIYVELGNWDNARKHLQNLKDTAQESDEMRPVDYLLDFIDRNPPGMKLPEPRHKRGGR